jgi:transposase
MSEPAAIAAFITIKMDSAKRIGLETGPTTTWLWHELRALGLPVICIDARHAKAALSMQINKSDRNEAVGLTRISACGTDYAASRGRIDDCKPKPLSSIKKHLHSRGRP